MLGSVRRRGPFASPWGRPCASASRTARRRPAIVIGRSGRGRRRGTGAEQPGANTNTNSSSALRLTKIPRAQSVLQRGGKGKRRGRAREAETPTETRVTTRYIHGRFHVISSGFPLRPCRLALALNECDGLLEDSNSAEYRHYFRSPSHSPR